MGILDEEFKKKLTGLDITFNSNPTAMIGNIIGKQIKEFTDKHRKEIEDKAENIHPVFGKTVRTLNNINDTIENAMDSNTSSRILREFLSEEDKEYELADHLFVQRSVYTHHGLYIGSENVIHYLREEGIVMTSLEVFADGAKIHRKTVNESPIRYSRAEVIVRAFSRLNEQKYFLLNNNCENFVKWCRAGGKEY
jgi:NC domain.